MPWRFGDLAVDSSLPFPNLPQSAEPAAIRIRRGHVDAAPAERLQEWRDPGGDVWLTIDRLDGGYRLTFPGLRCRVSGDGADITFTPGERAGDPWIAHVLLHQVLPLAVTRMDRFVVHACAVETSHGAIAFVGQSGSGKSTLAAAFCARGSRLIADDALMLQVGDTEIRAWPTADGVRLWNDIDWLVPGAPPLSDGWDKRHVPVALADRPAALVRMYETTYSRGEDPEITPLPLAPFRLAVLSNLFRLDVGDRAESRRQFDRVHALLARVPSRQLAFQDGEGYMDGVHAAVLADLAS